MNQSNTFIAVFFFFLLSSCIILSCKCIIEQPMSLFTRYAFFSTMSTVHSLRYLCYTLHIYVRMYIWFGWLSDYMCVMCMYACIYRLVFSVILQCAHTHTHTNMDWNTDFWGGENAELKFIYKFFEIFDG